VLTRSVTHILFRVLAWQDVPVVEQLSKSLLVISIISHLFSTLWLPGNIVRLSGGLSRMQ
jgi:hypothetical protein